MKHIAMRSHRGFSLVELMVGIAVSLVLMAIASSIFVGGVRSSRVQEERARQNETAQLIMDMLSRDIKNAGYFPALNPGEAKEGFVDDTWKNIVNPAVPTDAPAYNTPLYACNRAAYNRTTRQCETAGATNAPDTLVVNYFSDDTFNQNINNPPSGFPTFPGPGSGTRVNCLNQSVDGLPWNAARVGGGAASINSASVAPLLPVLVTNIYGLTVVQTYEGQQTTISTRSFYCWPEGPQAVAQPLFSGVEQIRYRFGINSAELPQTPVSFLSIPQMNALAPFAGKNAWQRVVAIEVCIVTRSLEFNAREARNDTGNIAPIKDCDGNDIAVAANQPRPVIAVSRETFNVRNSSSVTL